MTPTTPLTTGPTTPAHLGAPAERAAAGRALRSRVRRSAHGWPGPAADRPDPVTLLQTQAASRIPELVGLRYRRMAASEFSFFRGSAMVMAADLATTETTGLTAQLCGDAHLSNFGLFASPERHLVFDLNDFDETLRGPWEWDLKRLAASLEIAGRGNGFTPDERHGVVLSAAREYQRAVREFAGWTNLAVWYAGLAVERILPEIEPTLHRDAARTAQRLIERAKSRDHLQAFSSLVVTSAGGELRFRNDPPLLVPVEDLVPAEDAAQVLDRVRASMRGYRGSLSPDRRALLDQYRLVHVARKVVGVGSVGTRAWVLLTVGRDVTDPMILQVKEAQASALEGFVGRSGFANAGERVVVGQRIMQTGSDILLGWQRFAGFDDVARDFYVRQLKDWKGSVEVEQMSAPVMSAYGQMCAWTLARAHSRSTDRIALSGYLGGGGPFAESIADFARGYAEQNAADHAALVAAIESGRVSAR